VPVEAQLGAAAGGFVGEGRVDILKAVGADGGVIRYGFLGREKSAL
jgi:hypothetical protein